MSAVAEASSSASRCGRSRSAPAGPKCSRTEPARPAVQGRDQSRGQLIMSPAKNVHAFYQGRVAELLKRRLGGHVFAECSIGTPEGVKVADVAWCSDVFLRSPRVASIRMHVAPEICVEIKSPFNAESGCNPRCASTSTPVRRRSGRSTRKVPCACMDPRARCRRRVRGGRRGRCIRLAEGRSRVQRNAVRYLAAVFACMTLLTAQAASPQDGVQPGDEFLHLVDAKQYAESWGVASELRFAEMVPRRSTEGRATRHRRRWASRTRVVEVAKPQKNPPAAPPGDYLLHDVRDQVRIAGAARTETLALIKGPTMASGASSGTSCADRATHHEQRRIQYRIERCTSRRIRSDRADAFRRRLSPHRSRGLQVSARRQELRRDGRARHRAGREGLAVGRGDGRRGRATCRCRRSRCRRSRRSTTCTTCGPSVVTRSRSAPTCRARCRAARAPASISSERLGIDYRETTEGRCVHAAGRRVHGRLRRRAGHAGRQQADGELDERRQDRRAARRAVFRRAMADLNG